MPDAFTSEDYLERVKDLNVAGGTIVSGSFQAFDQGYLINALEVLGKNFVGVTQIPVDTSDEEIQRLDAAGIRAVRFNLKRGGSAGTEDIDALARRVHEIVGWHSEFYVDSRELPELKGLLASLPAISIDHLGMHDGGLNDLLELVDKGAHVKATGFGRIELDPAIVMHKILEVNPGALFVGTDVPSTRARRPFEDRDLDLIAQTAGDHAEAVFWDNAARFYRL